MPQYIVDCPRCGAQRMTFDDQAAHIVGQEHGWMTFTRFAAGAGVATATPSLLSTIGMTPITGLSTPSR